MRTLANDEAIEKCHIMQHFTRVGTVCHDKNDIQRKMYKAHYASLFVSLYQTIEKNQLLYKGCCEILAIHHYLTTAQSIKHQIVRIYAIYHMIRVGE